MLNAKQLLRAAARHARQLASEICEGTAPELPFYSYCGCAIGEVVKRTLRIPSIVHNDPAWKLCVRIDGLAPDDPSLALAPEGLVSAGLRRGKDGAVFPLLALADELENAAKGRPQDLP